MRLLWVKIRCLKSAVTLFFWAKSNLPLMGLSNEVLYILAAQEAAKQPEVKVGDTKKNPGLEPRPLLFGLNGRISFRFPTLTFGSFAVSWATRVHSISFESPDTEENEFTLKKEFESTFRVFFLHSKNPHFNSIYLVRVPFLTGIAVFLSKNS